MSTLMKDRLIQNIIVCFRYLVLFLVLATTMMAIFMIPDMFALMARLAGSQTPMNAL